MIPVAFEYQRASSIEDALARLAAADGAKLLAGGHSLVPLMKLRLSEPAVLIDITRVAELAGVREVDGRIEIGAGTTHHAVATAPLLRRRCAMVADTAGDIGDPQVRNHGTLGGSLAHADPAADYPAVMLALDADIHLRSTSGARVVKAADFFRDLFTVDLEPGEMIVGVRFAPAAAAAYAKLHQRASRFAIVGVAAVLDVADGIIRGARIGLTGAATHATRLTAVEAALAGQPATPSVLDAAARLAADGLTDVSGDIHASEDYRRAMVPVFTRRALAAAAARVE